ncbi:folliculin-interacting protein 2 isoform X2 [Venturia canescens]|uniref:folliculin-interacting protein 2 isoform X2 n=1 Tax=Venturia canescens TaxID=32260 RepID=UPI001C9C9E9E|nr:folliculin-interacting protein 2 isoform X2 [Venturia canescens]
MMPLLNKLLSTRNSSQCRQSDCRLLVNFGIGANDRNEVHFGADQIRILLFRECEWRGRKLLFDSVSARKVSNASGDVPSGNHQPTQQNGKPSNSTCPRNGTGLIAEHEKVACDDVSLLSEMIFGTVAMTYRGSLFKVHALNAPRCIMCTKVFPAPDHSARKLSERQSDELLRHSTTVDSNSSSGSTRNTMPHMNSGNFSANSLSPGLRKNSTCSSTSSGWDIDIPLLGSTQSLESNGSSGFGSSTSLRRRWLRAVSTTLSHAELEEKFGIQAYCENLSNENRENCYRRHKTRFGLAVLIQLTPGFERQMETRLLEHVGQLETMLNRLCYACIETCRCHRKSNGECKGLTSRMHRASNRCITWLLRLLSNINADRIPSLWHEVITSTSTPLVHRTHTLHRNLRQICQLINGVDTKSTNFFLSTVLTAVLTHHLGWVQTVMSPKNKQLMEDLGKRYPCNPLWAQLGDLYGALGNPSKLVHTVIAGDSDKTELINGVLTCLSYFIRSAVVKKRREYRCSSEQDVREAIAVLERKKRTNERYVNSSHATNKLRVSTEEGSSVSQSEELRPEIRCKSSMGTISTKSICADVVSPSKTSKGRKISSIDSSIPRLKRTTSAQKNLDTLSSNSIDSRLKCPVKVETLDDDDPSIEVPLLSPGMTEKNYPTSTVKIIVSETTTGSPTNDVGGTKKRIPRVAPRFNLQNKVELEESELDGLTMATKLAMSLQRRNDSGFDSQKFYPEYCPLETEAFYARLDVAKNEQQSQVFFTLGEEDKSFEEKPRNTQQIDTNCQCSFAFTRVPSTSAELPEGVLRKIIQRNFPESSKSIQRPSLTSFRNEKLGVSCPKCNGAGLAVPQTFEGSKLLLETPTNATEVLRTCGNSVGNRAARLFRSNSLEALMEANNVVELPMPRSKKSAPSTNESGEVTGFTKTLLPRRVKSNIDEIVDSTIYDSGYTSGLVIQGLTKKKRRKEKSSGENHENENVEIDWLTQLREEVNINAKFPVIDQPVSEALCILADMDSWQVGVLSNTSTVQNSLVPVGMSRLVATMLESFAYLWTKYRSPTHCIGIFECKLREMWLRSEALAEMLMAVDVCDVTIGSLTKALDLDAADIPLLLAVATTHSPQIAQRFGLSLA